MLNISIDKGEQDDFCDVGGVMVGQAHDPHVSTGVTVILPDQPITMAVDVRGGGPGTRETDALHPACLVDKAHGLVLSGGSVFGLSAADAVAVWLSDRGTGLPIAPRPVPVVPSAVLFDLTNGGDKQWAVPPYPALAQTACQGAGTSVAVGRFGAGYGARCGGEPGGIGCASAQTAEGLRVSAIVAVNAFGDRTMASGGEAEDWRAVAFRKPGLPGMNTSLGAVATNLALDKAACQRLAIMAQDGFARALRPIHTPFDGDTMFALATGEKPVAGPLPLILALAGTMASDCVVRAVEKAVSAAQAPSA